MVGNSFYAARADKKRKRHGKRNAQQYRSAGFGTLLRNHDIRRRESLQSHQGGWPSLACPIAGSAKPAWTAKTTISGASETFAGLFRCIAVFGILMKNQALQYYMHDGPTAFRFELAGNLDYESVPRLDQDWQTASSAIGDRRLIVDMTFVTAIDEKGGALLRRWHQEGAELIANSKLSRVLTESILGEPLPASAADARVSDRTWLPFRASFLVRPATLLLLATIAFPVEAKAATLKPATVIASDDHLKRRIRTFRTRPAPARASCGRMKTPSAPPRSAAERSSSLPGLHEILRERLADGSITRDRVSSLSRVHLPVYWQRGNGLTVSTRHSDA